MKNLFKQNAVFLTLSLILLIVLGLALLGLDKGELHLLLCDRHTPARDIFYRYYTQVAEWFPYVVCVCLLLFGRLGDGVFASSAMIGSALTTQLFKNIVNAPRPLVHSWFSFPSGHTTSFFALALVVCILLTNKLSTKQLLSTLNPQFSTTIAQLSLFVLALLGGYSRIYLSQHFSADVFAGIVVGILITIACYAIFIRFEDKKWYNLRLFAKK